MKTVKGFEMGKVKSVLMSIEEVNTELAMLADDERQERVQELFEEMLDDYELLRQYEAMSYSQQLEDFSPFDTVNS